jgi:hypothetical protein
MMTVVVMMTMLGCRDGTEQEIRKDQQGEENDCACAAGATPTLRHHHHRHHHLASCCFVVFVLFH